MMRGGDCMCFASWGRFAMLVGIDQKYIIYNVMMQSIG